MKMKFLAAVSIFTLLVTITAALSPCDPSATRLYALDVTVGQCAYVHRGDCCPYTLDFDEHSRWSRQYDGLPNEYIGALVCPYCFGPPPPTVAPPPPPPAPRPYLPYGSVLSGGKLRKKILKHA